MAFFYKRAETSCRNLTTPKKAPVRAPEQPLLAQTLTSAEANECLFASIKAGDPPLVDGAKIFAINTTYKYRKKKFPKRQSP